jgi:hypothetical protein
MKIHHVKTYLRRDIQLLKKFIKLFDERFVIYWLHFQFVIADFNLEIQNVKWTKMKMSFFYLKKKFIKTEKIVIKD